MTNNYDEVYSSFMHAPVRRGCSPLLRSGLSASSASSGAIPAVPLRQHLRVGCCQTTRWHRRPAGPLLHAVLPLCLGGRCHHCCVALSDTTADSPTGSPLLLPQEGREGCRFSPLWGDCVELELRAFVSALALPARRECPLGWRMGGSAHAARSLGVPSASTRMDTAHAAHCGHPRALLDGGAGVRGVLFADGYWD